MSYLKQAFELACEDAKTPEGSYVCLIEDVPFFGGPEEGGWYGEDSIIVAYQYCETEEEAAAIKEKIQELAQELQIRSEQEYGDQCLREMNWLDDRGLDADFLPEPDGPSTYRVHISESLPRSNFGCRNYS